MKRGGTWPDGSCKHKLNQRGEGPAVEGKPTEICGDCGAWRQVGGDWRDELELAHIMAPLCPFGGCMVTCDCQGLPKEQRCI